MDRRQKKSREAIFNAFTRLLEQKHFNNITVQEIIDEADVVRTTFYAHFETKDVLLKEMCTQIYEHIFSHELLSENSHDFSKLDQGLEERLTHFLFHIKDNKGNIIGLLSGDSSELFLRYFKEMLRQIFVCHPEYIPQGVTEEFAVNHLVGSFIEAIRWWVINWLKESPDKVVFLYMKMINVE